MDFSAKATRKTPLASGAAGPARHRASPRLYQQETMVGLDSADIRSYIAKPARGRRDWSEEPEAQAPVYRNRRRIRGTRGRRLMRRRGAHRTLLRASLRDGR